ncbi:uncharacterized protein C3orf22 homolog isoform X2 [Callithrix jacchus]
MDSRAHQKSHLSKKWRIQAQENFAKRFPYRFSLLTEPDPEPLQPWKVTNNSNMVQLPLQKRLVPTRSIPVRGVGVRIKEYECPFQDFIPNVHSHRSRNMTGKGSILRSGLTDPLECSGDTQLELHAAARALTPPPSCHAHC